MKSPEAIYQGDSGEATATFRSASRPAGYTTKAGTVGHFLAAPSDTCGRFSLYRWDMSATSGGPDPHFHRTCDETFYIIHGSVRLYDGIQWYDAQVGDLLHVPAGGIHAFTNQSGAPASMLMLMTPGADRAAYFNELTQIAISDRQQTAEEWVAMMSRNDNVMLTDQT